MASAANEGTHPALVRTLLLLTLVSGVADAVSFLGLGRVFVANATGNIAFLGFAAAGAKQLSALASLIALACFMLGALAGGRLARHFNAEHRPWLLRAFALQLLLVGAATVVAIAAGHAGDRRYALIAPLALAMGLQNATARRLAVPDLTTTVLTLTLTGIAADAVIAGGENPRWQRRVGSVGLMLAGAFVGALLVLKVSLPAALALILALLVAATVSVSEITYPAAATG